MSDNEKVQFLIGYLEGVIGGHKYSTTIDVEATKKIIATVSKNGEEK